MKEGRQLTENRIERLTAENFGSTSLDGFVRTQPVTEVWRRTQHGYCLVLASFIDDWSPERRREIAKEILSPGHTAYGVFREGRVAGFLLLHDVLNEGRMIVEYLHVSREFRRQGIGRALFQRALAEGAGRGARQLYLSACSARETVAFYRAMGCVPADPVIREIADKEPCDVQLTCAILPAAQSAAHARRR